MGEQLVIPGFGGVTQEATTATIANMISTVATDLPSAVAVVWTTVSSNVWLSWLVGFSIVMLGFRAFRRAKRIAQG